jgi:hypothetical protein
LGINSIAFFRNPARELAKRVADEDAVGLGRHAIYESAPGASLDQVRGMISRAIVRHKIKGVVLDYWQLVGGKAKGETEEYHLRSVAQWLADTCRKHGLWAIVACQVNQEGNTRRRRAQAENPEVADEAAAAHAIVCELLGRFAKEHPSTGDAKAFGRMLGKMAQTKGAAPRTKRANQP